MGKLRHKTETVDMTTGSPGRRILLFALPMIFGNVVQQLYSMVDSAVVGRFVGKQALASVGATMSVLNLVIFVIIGLTVGTCIVTAQYFGSGDMGMVKDAAGTAIYISIGMWFVIAVLGTTVSLPVLRALHTPADIIQGAHTYLLINTVTSLAPIIYNMTAYIMSSLGDSKGLTYSLVCSSVLNIILDLIFVIYFHWGVAGVAWATVISEAVAAIVNLNRIRTRHPVLRLSRDNLRVKPPIVKRILSVGIPVSIQNAVSAVGMLGVQGMVNQYGTNTVAAYTAANKIDQIAIRPLDSLGTALSTYVGQNYGKGDGKRIKAGARVGVFLSVCMGLLLMAFILPLGTLLPQLFLKPDEADAIHIAQEYLRTVALFYWICGIQYVLVNLFRGMGYMKISTFSSCLEPVVKLCSAWALGHIFGRSALWFAWPLGWTAASIFPAIYFLRGKWQRDLRD